jgi:5'-nucleotidase
MGIVPVAVDLVVSGVNLGPRLRHDLAYSGTVTAATEAALSGLPAIAISLASREDPSSWNP